MAKPPLHALQGFVAAARSGNLSRAADSLHLTVSALSHQIRGLEERIGQRLFVRNARGVELTGDGRQLFDRVALHFDALEQALRPFRVGRDDVLTISLMPSFAASWLVPRLPRFLAQHPQLEINLQSTSQLVDFERDGAVDAGLRFGRGQYPGPAKRASARRLGLPDDQPGPHRPPRHADAGHARPLPPARRAGGTLERMVRAFRRHRARSLRRDLR